MYELTGDTWNQVARLVEPQSGSHAQNQFGYVVFISGADPGTPDRLLVGRASSAPRLLAPDGTAFDMFGTRVALNGNVALISATGYSTLGNEAAGAVYAFRRDGSTWTLEAQFARSEPAARRSACLRATTLAIGCWNPAGSREGAAYVFERSGAIWSQAQKLILANPKPFDQFGSALTFGYEASLFVGAYRRNIDFMDQGAVYVYRDDVLFRNGFE